MKKFNFLSNLWSLLVGSRKDDGSTRYRLVIDSLSTRYRVWPLKLVSVLAILLTIGVGNVWGTVTVPSGWTQVTALSEIGAGDTILIVVNDTSMYLNGSVNSSGHFETTALSASKPASASAAGVIKLESTGTSNRYKLKLISTSKYITALDDASGNASVSASSDSYGWQFEGSSGTFDAKYQETGKQAYIRSYSNSTFRTYGNKSGASFRIFKYSAPAPTYNVYLMSGCTGGGYTSNKGTYGSGTGSYSSCIKYSGITAGTSVTITATPSSGYQFDGWTLSESSIILDDASNEITPSSSTASTATFTMPSSDVVIWQCNFSSETTYTITWSVNGSTSTDDVAEGQRPTPPDVDPSDYCGDKLIGWSKCAITGSVGSESSVSAGGCGLYKSAATIPVASEDITYYAVFADENP